MFVSKLIWILLDKLPKWVSAKIKKPVMINVLLIEDHVMVRQNIPLILDGIKGISVVGEVSTGEEGLKLIRENEPDIVILDF